MLCFLLLFERLYYIGLAVRKPVFGGWRTTNSVGVCVIPCAFLAKMPNIHFHVENVSCLRKKMFTILPWPFNITVTSQVAYSFLAYLRLESGV